MRQDRTDKRAAAMTEVRGEVLKLRAQLGFRPVCLRQLWFKTLEDALQIVEAVRSDYKLFRVEMKFAKYF